MLGKEGSKEGRRKPTLEPEIYCFKFTLRCTCVKLEPFEKVRYFRDGGGIACYLRIGLRDDTQGTKATNGKDC